MSMVGVDRLYYDLGPNFTVVFELHKNVFKVVSRCHGQALYEDLIDESYLCWRCLRPVVNGLVDATQTLLLRGGGGLVSLWMRTWAEVPLAKNELEVQVSWD